MAALRLLGLCGAVGLPLCRAGLADAGVLLQTSSTANEGRGSVTMGEAFVDLLARAFSQMQANASHVLMSETEAEDSASRPVKGFRFSRTSTEVEDGSKVTMLMRYASKNWADDDLSSQGCAEKDDFGSKRCKFPYGSNLHVKFAAKIGRPVEEGSRMIIEMPKPEAKGGMAAMIAKKMQPISVECPACSNHEKCHITYMGHNVSVKVPPCPIPSGETVFVDKEVMLPNLPVISSVDGKMQTTVKLIREDNSTLGKFSMFFALGPLPADDAQEAAEGPSEATEEQDARHDRHHHHKHHR
mmetsp:Transcript_9680/g.28577  ORF Transcript_9680/g.28577 Transcript_9680/m.28577 type:complete len:299 (+) Transcript_9680:78-974(+)